MNPTPRLQVFEHPATLQITKALPAVFYFALSGEDSLSLFPYSQPADFLSDFPLRVYSMNIPGHGPGLDPHKAMHEWSKEILNGRPFIHDFIQGCLSQINRLIDEKRVDPHLIGVAGLSRGGFIATHLAAQDPRIRYVLGYAPLTDLNVLEEFRLLNHPMTEELNPKYLIPKLIHKHLRYYVGNRDLRVGTTACFEFIHSLANQAYESKIRVPQAELIITPSIGHKGHGTSTQAFRDGAIWLGQQLCVSEYR